MLNFLTDSEIISTKSFHDLPIPSEIILDNAWDPHHVSVIHKSMRKCEVIKDFDNVVVLLYEFVPVSWLPFISKKFLVIKNRSSLKPEEIHYLTFPVSFRYISWSTVKAKSCEEGSLLEHHLRLRLPKIMNALFGWFLSARREQEDEDILKEDIEIMLERKAALEKGFKENLKCLPEKEELLSVWF